MAKVKSELVIFTDLDGTLRQIERVLSAIEELGLNMPGGSYYDVMGGNDKGRATVILIEIFARKRVSFRQLAWRTV